MLYSFFHLFFELWLEMAPWLLAGFALAFVCSFLLSERWIRRHLGGAGWTPILKASLLGLPLPVCSCGVLLVALALRRSGARKAPVCAFLASTPQSGTDAILLSWPLLGPLFTLLRFCGAFCSGLLAGALVRWFGIAQPPPEETPDLSASCAAVCACHHHDSHHPHEHGESHHHEFVPLRTRLWDSLRYAFIHLPGEIAPLLTLGIFIAAGITLWLPTGILTDVPLLLSYALAILIGLPTYACSIAIIPVATGLLVGGVSPGAVFLFMACAPTTHLGALLVMGRELGWRTAVLYTLAIIGCGFFFAFVIDFGLQLSIPTPAIVTEAHHHCHHLGILESLIFGVTTLILTHGTVLHWVKHLVAKRHHLHHSHSSEGIH